ncbi:hypothetical protein BJX96DRAFT_14035 [Aspergillus floccosus]
MDTRWAEMRTYFFLIFLFLCHRFVTVQASHSPAWFLLPAENTSQIDQHGVAIDSASSRHHIHHAHILLWCYGSERRT